MSISGVVIRDFSATSGKSPLEVSNCPVVEPACTSSGLECTLSSCLSMPVFAWVPCTMKVADSVLSSSVGPLPDDMRVGLSPVDVSTCSEDPLCGFFSEAAVCEDAKGLDGSFSSKLFSVNDGLDPSLRTVLSLVSACLCRSSGGEIGLASGCVDDGTSVGLLRCWGERCAGSPLASRSFLISPGDAKSLEFFEGEPVLRALRARPGDLKELSPGLITVAGTMDVSDCDGSNTVTGCPA